MTRKFWLAAIMLLATGLIAVGCGDDEDEESSTDAPATEETSEAPEVDTGSAEGDEAVQAAVEACKSSITTVPNLSEDTISKLEGICDDAASGDAEAVTDASKDVCIAIIEDTVPEGSTRESALDACESAPGAP